LLPNKHEHFQNFLWPRRRVDDVQVVNIAPSLDIVEWLTA
jgi:hypothetical protein